jgi:hypothetical protein
MPALLGAAMTAVFVAGCGTAAISASPARSAGPTASPAVAVASTSSPPSAGASGSAGASASASAAASALASASAEVSIPLPHVDAALEDLLPSTIGGISLEKFSLTLSAYIASSNGGDRALYPPWLLKFGKTPADVNIAVAADLTQQENFIVHAIKVPGVADATLSSSFADVARAAGWPIATKTIAAKTVLEMIDPAALASGGLSAGYVYAKNGVLYTVITDNSSLLLEALIKLP